jgi:hypothetical protein
MLITLHEDPDTKPCNLGSEVLSTFSTTNWMLLALAHMMPFSHDWVIEVGLSEQSVWPALPILLFCLLLFTPSSLHVFLMLSKLRRHNCKAGQKAVLA